MSRIEAIEQYRAALRQGRKYYNSCVTRGEYPYPQVLNQILDDSMTAGNMLIGTVDIPMDRVVGTWMEGRKSAFAGNFMPLLEADTEFGNKWIDLCASHLDEGGIRDPITCFEYLGRFYVQEGNKRVSVLKSFDAPTIRAKVTRIIPAPSQDPAIQIYYEFMKFYKVSQLYQVTFSQPGGYAKLQAALGFEPEQPWTEEARRNFSNDFRRFTDAFTQLNTEKLPLTPADALLVYLQVYPFSDLRAKSDDQIRQDLNALWPDVRLVAKGKPISVSAMPEPAEKRILPRIFGGTRIHAAFIYDYDPIKSAWASAHERGQKYLQEKLGQEVQISAYLAAENPDDTMEQAIQAGANVIFATSPMLIDACRRVAGKHKNVCVYNCSLSMPYAGVRGYYCRIYESKFNAGAVAGAMAREDRIGYVANYPIMGAITAVNAFALGARLTNPRAVIELKWSCLPGNPVKEFWDEGVSVISNRDADGAKKYLAWNMGTYECMPNGDMQPLASPRWNWGKFYEKTVRSLMLNGLDSARDSEHAVNDWWGLSAGMVSVDLDERLPDGVKQLALILKNGIIDETIDPFLCPIRDQQGRVISDGTRRFTAEELMGMDWLCNNISGSIPGFDELIPQSQNLVRLLGIYRQQIPPRTEETAL